jgi:selenide, water dikinase
MEKVKLTHYSKGSGCGCKVSPAVLRAMLGSEDELPNDPRLLIGYDTSDDAAVVKWDDRESLISTVDFFTPVVDDAFDFGRIAAANALSDVYAMGGEPLTAVAVMGWPTEKLPTEVAAKVLAGGRFMCRMAGIQLAGGHTIDAPEPFFGLAVTGRVLSAQVKRNSSAEVGDVLFLTKPLGNGIVTTAAKRGMAEEAHLRAAVTYMCTLNKVGSLLGKQNGVTALTDVTGFGLLGHLLEVCEGSRVGAVIKESSVPVYPFIQSYLEAFVYPDMTTRNYSALNGKAGELSGRQMLLYCDPQTSGGLLVACRREAAKEVSQLLRENGLYAESIGQLTEGNTISFD